MAKSKPKLSQEMIDNIKNYASEIKTIELFVDSVRKNPGQYLSSIGNEGWMNAVREVFQNGMDEMRRPASPCNKVWITYYEATHRCIVADNGRALAPDIICRVFTREHTSVNFEKKKGEYPSGLHGVGSKCTNAVSIRFSVYSYFLGKGYYMEFSEGKPLKKYVKSSKSILPEEIPNPDGKQGLVVDFEPDMTIMRKITIKCEDVLNLVANIVPLTDIGNTVEFTGYKADGKVIHEILENKDGVMTYLIHKTQKPMIKPIIFGYDSGVMKADVAMTWEADPNASPDVLAFANTTPVNAQLSTPSVGFIRGVSDFFRNYMNKIYLVNNKKAVEVISSDVTSGLKAAVAAAHINVMFDGQAKNVCKNGDLLDFVRQLTFDSLQEWSKVNPDDLQKLCQYIKDVSIARAKADKAKSDVSKKYNTNDLLSIPKGFVKAENKDHLELFIVEGLSASSPCETGRDSRNQAIFAIRGKMPNAMSTSREKMLNNEEVSAILGILGCGYGKNFDISKCKYDKIIILADNDLDGYHIRVLILIFFLIYCRPLVEEGRLYVDISPLYHINKGKKDWVYLTDKNAFISYVQTQFFKSHKILDMKTKKPYTRLQVENIIISNTHYKSMMDTVSDNLAIDPVFLEDILLIRNMPFAKFSKLIIGKYRFVDVDQDKKNGAFILRGLVREKSHMVILNQELIRQCSLLLPYIDGNDSRYLVDGQKLGLYEFLDLFEKSEPKNISRAKGLGALDAKEIAISTLDPKNRTLLRYTSNDIERDIATMRKTNDNKLDLIKDVDMSQYEF